MAQIVAKAMAKGANVDKLAAEFADELDNLGVRVANLEKKADNVKITGEVRYHYADHDTEGTIAGGNENKLRTRITLSGQVNEDWKYTGLIENTQDFDNNAGEETKTLFQRAYMNGKIGGLAVQAGRYNNKIAEGNVYDTRFDGVQVAYGKDVKLTAGYGKATPSTVAKIKDAEVFYTALTGKVGALVLDATYNEFKDINSEAGPDTGVDNKIWTVAANYAFNKDLKLGAMYLNGDLDNYDKDDDGYVVTLSYKGAKAATPGTWGVVAKYYDQGYSTIMDHTMNGKADKFGVATEGFKGYSLAANYTFAKNIVGQVEYYDLEAKEGEDEAQTLWAQVVFTF